MFVDEYEAKQLIALGGVPVPPGLIATTPDGACGAASELFAAHPGSVMVKARLPTSGSRRVGDVARCTTPSDVREAADQLLGSELGGVVVDRVLIEAC